MNDRCGRVHLVGAGPGDPGLITLKGLRLLRAADVVVHDRLIPPELMDEVRRGAEVVDVGKCCGRSSWSQEEINGILVERARQGLSVVRLKGGDPCLFGRGGEEWLACREAGVPCEVVPGVPSAFAVPECAGIPPTHRGASSSVAVIAGHASGGEIPELDYKALARIETLVILMGRSTLRAIVEALIAAGRDPFTPAACIEKGTTPEERRVTGILLTIADRADEAGLEAPVTTVIGETVGLSKVLGAGSQEGGRTSAVSSIHSERTDDAI